MKNLKYTLTLGELCRLTGEDRDTLRESLPAAEAEPRTARTPVPSGTVREILHRRGVDYRFRVVAMTNLRGGIGKTTCTVTFASRAKQYGFKTCILDLDAQGSASLAFDRSPEEDDPIFYDVWQKPEEMVAGSLKKIEDDLHILPSALENGLLDVSLMNPTAQKNAVRGVCEELRKNGFDLVVIDCPPSLGAAVISTICAADVLVLPLWSDTFSFKGVDLTLEEVSSICETFNLEPPVVKLLYSRHDKREKLSAWALERLRTEYRDYFIPSVIGTSTAFSKALAHNETIFATSRSTPIKAAYDEVVRAVLEIEITARGGRNGEA